MISDDKGYRFEPAELTIKQGDAIKFVMIYGRPAQHRVRPGHGSGRLEGAARREHGQQDR